MDLSVRQNLRLNVTQHTAAALSNAAFAKRAGYIESFIIVYVFAMLCPKGATHVWPRGFMVQGVCEMILQPSSTQRC